MKYCFLYLLILASFSLTYAEEDLLAELSRYEGYVIWKNELERHDIQYDMEEVIRGMRLAAEGQAPEFSNSAKLNEKLDELLGLIVKKKKEEKLAAAEAFLINIQREPEIREVIKDKLYYKQLQAGLGQGIKKGSKPHVVYSVRTLEEEEEPLPNDPKPISLSNTILGFEEGVVGMRIGERRVLFIHPDLAYGPRSSWVPSNSLLIINVEVTRL